MSRGLGDVYKRQEKTPLISAITIQGKTLTIKTVRTTDMSVFDEITIRK